MRPTTLTLLALAFAAGPVAAQTEGAPQRGKIDGVEREKDKDRGSSGDDCNCGPSWWLETTGEALVHLFSPRGSGRAFQRYPWAGGDTVPAFTVRHDSTGRRFGAVSAAYFADAGSTLKGGRFAFEGGAALAYFSLELNSYLEPLASETDHLHSWRAGIGVLPRIGPNGLLRLGVAARGIILDDGTSSGGPELELGTQLFPRRPFGVSINGRLSAQQWSSGGTFAFRELNTTGSVFVGRVEIQAGWHWVKIGGAPAFGGPTMGTRVWF